MFADMNKATTTTCQSDESHFERHPTLLWSMQSPWSKHKDDFLVDMGDTDSEC